MLHSEDPKSFESTRSFFFLSEDMSFFFLLFLSVATDTNMAAPGKRTAVAAVEAATAPSSGKPKVAVRKRSRQIHDKQVMLDFFSENDVADDAKPPTELISKMAPDELYDDVYQDDVDVSLAALPVEKRDELLDGLRDAAPKFERRAISSSTADPTAISIPSNHMHEIVRVPEAAITATNALAAIQEGHRAELSRLPAYEVIENLVVEHECYGSHQVTLRELMHELRACVPHGVQRRPGGMYVIFELGRRDTFYAAVEFKMVGDVPEYATWTKDLEEALADVITGEFESRVYFDCGCI